MDEIDDAMQALDPFERRVLAASESALAPLIATLRMLDVSRVPVESNAVYAAPPASLDDRAA
jgi:hypothetical protein